MIYLWFSDSISQYHPEVPWQCLTPFGCHPQSFLIQFPSIRSRPPLLIQLQALSGCVSTHMHLIFQGGMYLGSSAFSAGSHKKEGPVAFIAGKHFDRCPLWDVPYPTNSIADGPACRFDPKVLPQWPWWNIHSTSFYPLLVACKNISWRITDWCGVPNCHQVYLSRKSSTSIWHSASLTEVPISLACSWALRDLQTLPP